MSIVQLGKLRHRVSNLFTANKHENQDYKPRHMGLLSVSKPGISKLQPSCGQFLYCLIAKKGS